MANLFEAAATLFGFEINAKKREEEQPVTFVPPNEEDGATTVTTAASGSYGTYLDLDNNAKTEAELISKYRQISLEQEIEFAIEQIVNEAIAYDEADPVSLDLAMLEGYSESIKKKIIAEFKNIIELMNFRETGPYLFRRWYIDGRTYHHVIIDEKQPALGIKELRYIDPRKIHKVREIQKVKQGEAVLQKVKDEFFVYNERGFGVKANFMSTVGSAGNSNEITKGLKIASDSIIYATSGLMNENNSIVLSYLQKAVKPLNQLRAMEDAAVIYRLSRAPERRIFYIDVGTLPKVKAEQYVNTIIAKHRNRLVYDATTGVVRDDRKHMTMLEDYFFPRRENGKATEVTTLPGGQNLGQIEDIEYFKQKLYESLNIPMSRFNQEGGFLASKSTEISRDEIFFYKFIVKIRKQFCHIFTEALKRQLMLKQIIGEEDWRKINAALIFEFAQDNHFTELKFLDMLTIRAGILAQIDPYIGTFYSRLDVRKKILGQTDEEIEETDEQIKKEEAAGLGGPVNPEPAPGDGAPMDDGEPEDQPSFTDIDDDDVPDSQLTKTVTQSTSSGAGSKITVKKKTKL